MADILKDKVPSNWSIVAQLIFGTPNEIPEKKDFISNDVKIFN